MLYHTLTPLPVKSNQRALYRTVRQNAPHSIAYTEPFIWTGNYKITEKRLYLPNETVLSKFVTWKPRRTSEEQAGRYNMSYKREKKPGDW